MNEIIKLQFVEAQKVLNDFLNDEVQLQKIEEAANLIAESIWVGG